MFAGVRACCLLCVVVVGVCGELWRVVCWFGLPLPFWRDDALGVPFPDTNRD